MNRMDRVHLFILSFCLQPYAPRSRKPSSRRCTVTTDIAGMELTHSAATTLFRMAQEALTNVARHAQASVVNVTMCVDEGELVLVIEDNGIGIAPEALHGSHRWACRACRSA